MKIFDRLFSESPTINILKHIASKDVPWGSEAILLYIESRLGKLKLVNGKTEKGLVKKRAGKTLHGLAVELQVTPEIRDDVVKKA